MKSEYVSGRRLASMYASQLGARRDCRLRAVKRKLSWTNMRLPVEPMSIHKPLSPKNREIRLLRLITTAPVLAFELRTFSLNDKPTHFALSYAWGSEPACRGFLVNGIYYNVRPNLYQFCQIWAARSMHEWIFIDAICINQADTLERSSQVTLMGAIYYSAIEVIAWLGARDDYSFEEISEHQMILADLHSLPSPYDPDIDGEAIMERLGKYDPEDMYRLAAPFMKPIYWTRLWIVQELASAGKLTFWFGDLLAPITTLTWCLHYSSQAKNTSDIGIDLETDPNFNWFSAMSAYFKMGDPSQRAPRQNLTLAMDLFTGQQCLDPKDKVFGLLGLTYSVLRPDYSTTCFEIYARAIAEMQLEAVMDREAAASQEDVALREEAQSGEEVVLEGDVAEAKISSQSGLTHVHLRVASALGLPNLHPAVMLATNHAHMMWLSIPSTNLGRSLLAEYKDRGGESKHHGLARMMHRLRIRMQILLAMCRMWWFRVSGLRVVLPSTGTERMSHAQLTAWLDAIGEEVLHDRYEGTPDFEVLSRRLQATVRNGDTAKVT